MVNSVSKELPALVIDVGIGVVGFILSIAWGKATGTKMSGGTYRLLAGAWFGVAVFGMVLAFIM
jgi:hypothetical protein